MGVRVKVKNAEVKWLDDSYATAELIEPSGEEINQLHGFDKVLAVMDRRDVKDDTIVAILDPSPEPQKAKVPEKIKYDDDICAMSHKLHEQQCIIIDYLKDKERK